MNEYYARALAGTLVSGTSTTSANVSLFNELGMSLLLSWVSPGGLHCGYDPVLKRFVEGAPGLTLPAGRQVLVGLVTDAYYVVTTAHSGAFVAVIGPDVNAPVDGSLVLDTGMLLEPGVIGPVPRPTADRPIPLDSPRVLVGCGTGFSGAVGREQYWRLSPDSYSLAPHETVSTSMTQTSGMDTTSSDEEVMATSLGVSTSAGWGPVSASVSASLSTSSTTFQQVTLNTQTTTFQSRERTNDSDEPVAYFVWQLTDVVTTFDSTGLPIASVVSTIPPPLVGEPWTPASLLPHPERRRMPPGAPGNRAPLADQPDE